MKFRSYILSVITVLICSVLITSCSKNEEKSSQKLQSIAASSTLTAKLPMETAGFVIWNAESEGFKKYKNSRWYQAANLASQIQSAQGASNPEIRNIASALSKSKLMETIGSDKYKLSDALLFLTIDNKPSTAMPVSGAIFLNAESGVALENLTSDITEVLSKEPSVNATPVKAGETSGLLLTFPDNPELKLYYEARKNLAGLATSQKLLNRLFTEGDGKYISELEKTPEFKTAMKEVSETGEEISIGYFDGSKFDQLDPSLTKDNPVKSVAFSARMASHPINFLSVSLKEGKAPMSAGKSFPVLPATSSFVISADSGLIDTLKEVAQEHDQTGMMAGAASQMQMIENLKQLTLSISAPANQATPFPDLALVADSSDPEKMQDLLIKQLTPLMQFFPGGWQNKTIGSTPVKYAVSMMGIGIYLGISDKNLILSSSESAAAGMFSAIASDEEALSESLSEETKSWMKENSHLFSVYIDFNQAAQVIQSAAGNVAMMTGGNASISPRDIQNLKKIGRILGYASSNGKSVKVMMAIL